MATRQKSFFDQEHSKGTYRGQWRPNRPFPPRDCPRPEYIPPPRPKSPIRASTKSRSKLQAFAYKQPSDRVMVDVCAAGHESDKENAEKRAGSKVQISQRAKSHSSAKLHSSSKSHSSAKMASRTPVPAGTPKPLIKKMVPPTPGVTLEDLMDGGQREVTPPDSTPIKDQVGWEHTTLRSSQLQPLTPATKRPKKRPRSESPPSSKGSNKGKRSARHKALQPVGGKTPLRTPRYEPGPDLWQRYAKADMTTPSRPPATAKADMMHSSPQDPFASDNRPWKRSTSDLTHTARKRRRLEARQNVIGSQGALLVSPTESCGNPGITHLLERLKEATEHQHEDVLGKEQETIAPSSSSPLPAGNVSRDEVPSASQRLAELVMSDKLADGSTTADQISAREPPSVLPYNVQDEAAIARVDLGLGFQNLPSLSKDDSSDHFSVGPSSDHEQITALVHERGVRYKAELDEHLVSAQEEETFSDLEIEEDDLLSTCIAAEQASVAVNAGGCDSGEVTEKSKAASRRDADEAADRASDGPPSAKPQAEAEFEDEFLDDFDADDLADLDMAMSGATRRCESNTESPANDQHPLQGHEFTNNNYAYEGLEDATAYGEQSNPVDLIDDEFGDDEIEDVFAELVTEQETKGILPSKDSRSQRKSKIIQRYLVEAVQDGQYQTDRGFKRQEKVVLVKEEKSGTSRVILLRDAWNDSPCTQGAYVHVLADFDKAGQCIIDGAAGILVIHPDHLISATVVADSFGCMRRAVLQDRVKATSEANEPLVYGSILHEVFQEALAANRWDTIWIDDVITKACARHLESLFEINVEVEQAVSRLHDKAAQLQSWASLFVKSKPGPNSVIKDRNGATALMSINKLLDVEEHIWSPMFGLKGNVDATVQVSMQDGEDSRILTVPLELKTGRNSSNQSHKAQTALYTLLMSDRYDIEVAYGILYYLETSEVSRVAGIRHELIHMIKQRNELACYVRNRLELPPMLKNERLCGRCYAQPSCFTYHKLVEDGTAETSGLKEVFTEKTQHLLPQHQDFFRKWDHLLTKEEGDLLRFRRELWTMTSTERQKVGRCFAKVVIEPGSAGEIPGAQKINRFKYTFARKESSAYASFAESQITVGEPIVISDEEGHYALANGYITSLRKTRVTVAVDRRLHNARIRSENFQSQTNQNFAGIMDVSGAGQSLSQQVKDSAEPVVYRIDKDEFSNGMATVRNNLIRLMEKDLFGSQPLRRLIIDKVPPITLKKSIQSTIPASQAQLNVDQKAAIDKVMTARDYALVLGMPGTGKTTTIAHIIRTLAAQGKSVLLTSYTHTAVDNILLKIRSDKIKVLRIGALAKVHPEVTEFADLTSNPKTSFDELRKSYNSQVVATTCLGINHSIFNQRIFDYCIVDEASQITLPVCLGPIRMAKTFILVGDHYQLPPLVQNKEALEGGLDVSLFKYLSDAHPDSVVTLEHQYRMCAEIMSLSNELIYSGRLKCGNDAVAKRRIDMPKIPDLGLHHHTPSSLPASQSSMCLGPKSGQCWLHDALHPSQPVLFLNTDGLGDAAREQARGSRIVNEMEVTLTAQLVRALLTAGVPASELGVITLYRSQLALMRQELKARSSAASAGHVMASVAAEVEMHTADKYQGRDKEAIILSLVRSNDANNVGDLLKDWRRVNVALTRARTKMIILGSWETISSGNELLSQFCQVVESKGWRYDLKQGAAQDHYFEDWLTQATGQQAAFEPPSPVKPAKISLLKAAKPRARLFQSTLDKENIVPHRGNHNPPYKRPTIRQPSKTITASAGTIMNKRPVLRNIAMELDEEAFGECME